MPTAENLIRFLQPENPQPNAPLLIYLPGMDGTGELLRPQIEGLQKTFDIRRLSIPVDDLTDWDGLVKHTAALIKAELRTDIPRRALYLCGESFGGCLALKLASQVPEICDRLILVNPASAFNRRFWLPWGARVTRFMPVALYPASCLGFLPFLASLGRIAQEDRNLLLRMMQSISLKSVLWRLSLLESFNITPAQLRQLKQPTLVISSGDDHLLPSKFEGELLASHIPKAKLHYLPYSGHAALLESSVNLARILQEEGFLEKAEEKNPVTTSSMLGQHPVQQRA